MCAVLRRRVLGSAVGAVALFMGAGWPAACAGTGAHTVRPLGLTVDDQAAPIGLGFSDVYFGWRLGDAGQGTVQTGYRIVVRADRLTLWDSGRIASSDQSAIPYGGRPLAPDSVYRWTVQTWDGAGHPSGASQPATFETGLSDRDWRAEWIRRLTAFPLDSNPAVQATESNLGAWINQDEYTYARKQVTLGRSPIVRARVYISADQRYELYVNGSQAGKGEAYEYPDQQYYETNDVTALVRAGAPNAFGILYNWQGPGKGRPAGSPGVIAQISVVHADGSRELVVTDGSWRVQRAEWLPGTERNQEGDSVSHIENINGLLAPLGWDQPGYNDATWLPATVIGRPPVAPWTHLVSARTRVVYQPVAAVSVTRLANGAAVADFGQVLAAIPTVTFHQGMPGRVVTMHAGFVLDKSAPSTVSTSRSTQATNMSYSYGQRGGTETFRPFNYLGFRYLQIDNPGEVLAPSSVVALARHVAMPDGEGATFSSSNATVNAVYALAAHSALFSSQEQFLDTPTREQSPFLRDGFNESEVDMVAFGEQNLTRKDLLEFAESQRRFWPDGRLNAVYPSGEYPLVRDIPDFTEIYPEWVWQYWLHTGDRALLRSVYPVLVNISNYVARAIDGRTGLVTHLPGGGGPGSDYNEGIVDWPATMRYGYDMATVARTTVNELAVDVFERTADVAAAIGRPASEIAGAQARRTALTAAINSRLTRPDGTYVDGLESNGAPSPHASQHANAYAIAYGIAPAARVPAVAAYVARLGMAMGPQTVQELLAALRLAGRPADAVARLTDARADGWAKILAEGGTFTWEDWNPSDANHDSMSHGWGATALVEITQTLLGVVPTGPAYTTFDVAPPAAGLTSASGRVPTPRGFVTVSWRHAGATFMLDLTVPPGATATVRVPGAPARTVGSGTYHF
jgi:alpha-L-rhamnosidase